MSIDDALARLARRPNLAGVVPRGWLQQQAIKAPEEWHPMYETLQRSEEEAGEWLDGLERAVGTRVQGSPTVAARLVRSDLPDWRSAVDELSFAARLASCGFDVILGNPDVVAQSGSDELRIELTAPLRTRGLGLLETLVASRWEWPLGVILFLGHQNYQPTAKDRTAIAQAIWAAASSSPTTSVEIDLSSIVDRSLLRAKVGFGWGRGVFTIVGGYGSYDGLAGLADIVQRKKGQLSGAGPVMLAVNLSGLHRDIYSWSRETTVDWQAGSGPSPRVDAPANVVGILAFYSRIPGSAVWLPVWVKNASRVGADPPLLQRVLFCLGWPPPSVAGPRRDGL